MESLEQSGVTPSRLEVSGQVAKVIGAKETVSAALDDLHQEEARLMEIHSQASDEAIAQMTNVEVGCLRRALADARDDEL